MAVAHRFRHRLTLLFRSENGMALPTAVFAMIASIGFASAAILASVNAQRGTHRDSDSKSAIAAADAGASVAQMRLNRFLGSIGPGNPCVGPSGETQTPSGGWCPATTPESVGDATYSYRISSWTEDGRLSVVSVGTADGVSRRIEVGLVSYEGEEVFADEKLIGESGITLEGTPDIRTDIGTNGSVESDGSGEICGDIRHGIGHTAPEPDCENEVTEGNKSLPPIVPPEGIATNNSNCQLEDPLPEGCPAVDTYSKNRTDTVPYDPTTRTIQIQQNATLTMGGQDYFVCRLLVQNGELIMANKAGVRIFFDTPENCGLEDGDVQVEITGNATIKSTGYNPDAGTFELPGLYLLGSPDITTQVILTGGSQNEQNEIMLYAPYSDVELGGNATWIGMIAGKTLRLHGTPTIESDPGIDPPDIFFSGLWERTRYVECTGGSGSPPDASC
jgi:hypothetical protein